ncbi:hypothetical protein [Amedibacillus sp. YH-ame10]
MKNNSVDENGNVIVEKEVLKKDNTHVIFYVLAVLLVLYMGYAAYTAYQTFVSYCASYNLNTSDQMGMLFQSVLANIIPCLAYAATMYGIGYLIKKGNA